MTRRQFSYRKARLKKKAREVSQAVSRIFRRVRISEEVDIGTIYDAGHQVAAVGDELEALVPLAREVGMTNEVVEDIAMETHKLTAYSEELSRVAEQYFGNPARRLETYATKLVQPRAINRQRADLGSLIGEYATAQIQMEEKNESDQSARDGQTEPDSLA